MYLLSFGSLKKRNKKYNLRKIIKTCSSDQYNISFNALVKQLFGYNTSLQKHLRIVIDAEYG